MYKLSTCSSYHLLSMQHTFLFLLPPISTMSYYHLYPPCPVAGRRNWNLFKKDHFSMSDLTPSLPQIKVVCSFTHLNLINFNLVQSLHNLPKRRIYTNSYDLFRKMQLLEKQRILICYEEDYISISILKIVFQSYMK